MSPRLGYKQTATHIRNSKRAKKKSASTRRAPTYQDVVDLLDDPANEKALAEIFTQAQKNFDAARAYLKRFDTTPDADLTPEERFIKRMEGRS